MELRSVSPVFCSLLSRQFVLFFGCLGKRPFFNAVHGGYVSGQVVSSVTNMRMFSVQSVDLRHFPARVQRTRGTYVQDQRIADALSKLYDTVVFTDQVVWCSLDEPEIEPLDRPQFLHTIEIDKRDMVAILDGLVWEHIIGNSRCIPPDERQKIMSSCYPKGNRSFAQELECMVDQYIAENLPSDLWDNVLSTNLSCRMPQILVRWPFEHSRITCVKRIQDQTT